MKQTDIYTEALICLRSILQADHPEFKNWIDWLEGTFRTGTSGGRLPIIFGHTVVWAHSMICPVCAEITTTFLTF